MAKQKTVHEKALAVSRRTLGLMDRRELLNRRTLLEVVIREADKAGTAWREQKAEDPSRLSVAEQYDLIEEALFDLDPDPGVVVNVQTGDAIVKTFDQGD
jgi:hypothetical protein